MPSHRLALDLCPPSIIQKLPTPSLCPLLEGFVIHSFIHSFFFCFPLSIPRCPSRNPLPEVLDILFRHFSSPLDLHSFLFSSSFPTSLPPRSLNTARFWQIPSSIGIVLYSTEEARPRIIFQRQERQDGPFILCSCQAPRKDPRLEFPPRSFGLDPLRRPGERE